MRVCHHLALCPLPTAGGRRLILEPSFLALELEPSFKAKGYIDRCKCSEILEATGVEGGGVESSLLSFPG